MMLRSRLNQDFKPAWPMTFKTELQYQMCLISKPISFKCEGNFVFHATEPVSLEVRFSSLKNSRRQGNSYGVAEFHQLAIMKQLPNKPRWPVFS